MVGVGGALRPSASGRSGGRVVPCSRMAGPPGGGSISTVTPDDVGTQPVDAHPANAPDTVAPLFGSRWNQVVFGATALVFAVLVWNRRWISDDGLIVLRTVRQLVAGHGPVFDVGERVEANTSTLWTALLALPGMVPGLSLNWAPSCRPAAVGGRTRPWPSTPPAGSAAPGRVWCPSARCSCVALPPFWDFGTSGLETGLIVGWLAACGGCSWSSQRLAGDAQPGAPAGRGLAAGARARAGAAGAPGPRAVRAGRWPWSLVLLESPPLGWRRLPGLGAVAAALPAGLRGVPRRLLRAARAVHGAGQGGGRHALGAGRLLPRRPVGRPTSCGCRSRCSPWGRSRWPPRRAVARARRTRTLRAAHRGGRRRPGGRRPGARALRHPRRRRLHARPDAPAGPVLPGAARDGGPAQPHRRAASPS